MNSAILHMKKLIYMWKYYTDQVFADFLFFCGRTGLSLALAMCLLKPFVHVPQLAPVPAVHCGSSCDRFECSNRRGGLNDTKNGGLGYCAWGFCIRGVACFLHKSAVAALRLDSSQCTKLLATKCSPYVLEATRFAQLLYRVCTAVDEQSRGCPARGGF